MTSLILTKPADHAAMGRRVMQQTRVLIAAFVLPGILSYIVTAHSSLPLYTQQLRQLVCLLGLFYCIAGAWGVMWVARNKDAPTLAGFCSVVSIILGMFLALV